MISSSALTWYTAEIVLCAGAHSHLAVTRQTRKDRSEVECEPTASALPLKINSGGRSASPRWQLRKEAYLLSRVPSMHFRDCDQLPNSVPSCRSYLRGWMPRIALGESASAFCLPPYGLSGKRANGPR